MKCEEGFLYLEDGTFIKGCMFGALIERSGEVVFSTAMNGYPDSLTDPSYKGQILILTHPLIGNYGVPEKEYYNGILKNFESENIQVEGLIVSEETKGYKWNKTKTLDSWLTDEGVPGLSNVDTRMLVKKIRSKGVMMGVISPIKEMRNINSKTYEEVDFTEFTSPKEVIIHEGKGPTVVVVDCGIKHGILYELAIRGFNVVRVPCKSSANKIISYNPKGVVYSNGPGNPNLLKDVIKSFTEISSYSIPILGICLGHQIAAISNGIRVEKMKFGHRGINKPVIEVNSSRCLITTHNHGYAVNLEDVRNSEYEVWFYNPDDKVIEGLRHKRKPIITVQFHPEARPGPKDATFVFDVFEKMVK
jgi:carbamoyl-phosphate synthase small subunit